MVVMKSVYMPMQKAPSKRSVLTTTAVGDAPSSIDPTIPVLQDSDPAQRALRQIYTSQGPEAFAKAVRAHEGLLVTDTTWRDAHQSLLATRVRTTDLLAIAPATRVALGRAYSLECWGGATFDVSMRFLKEDPWDRLAALREEVPDVPFQMLLRGANAVGWVWGEPLQWKRLHRCIWSGLY